MLNQLPPSSFVSATLLRLASPQLVWCRDAGKKEQIIRDYGFCAPLPGEAADAFLSDRQICHAERYGGFGVSGNGGGVRCGWFNGATVKGIGRTELAGQGAEFWHSYGGATMRAAIREAIWGEAYHTALPYGAVRADAVIGTGTEVPMPTPDRFGNTTTLRGLIVRQPFLRPAHYMRSLLFRPPPGFEKKYVSDAVRTAAAIRHFDAGLRASLGENKRRGLDELLSVAFRRYAAQISTMRAKRLLHGSPTISNIALDGRLLDFGGSSAVSDHGRAILGRGWPDPWNLHEPIANGVRELMFYLQKYLPGCGISEAVAKELHTDFQDELDRVFRFEMLKLSGMPLATLTQLGEPEIARFSDCFIDVFKEGNREPFTLFQHCPQCEPSMPAKMGRYHLGNCLKACAAAGSREAADAALQALLPDEALRLRLIDAYWSMRSMAIRQYPESNVTAFSYFNAERRNATLRNLYTFTLNPEIDQLLADGGDLFAYIEKKIVDNAILLREGADHMVFELEGHCTIEASPETGVHGTTQDGNSLAFDELVARLRLVDGVGRGRYA